MTFRRAGMGILLIAFLGLLSGGALATGRSDYSGIAARLVGAGVFLGSFWLLLRTAHRWAGYFVALSAIAAIKAVLALALGTAISVPRVAVEPRLDGEILALLLVIFCLTFRFAARPPRSQFEAFSLTAAAAGVALSILTEPGLLPLAGACIILAASWLMDQTNKDRSRKGSHSHFRV